MQRFIDFLSAADPAAILATGWLIVATIVIVVIVLTSTRG